MGKKVGIITLFGYENFGNRLQMYATQKIYESLGFKSEIIRYEKQVKPVLKLKIFIAGILKYKTNYFKLLKVKNKKIEHFIQHSMLFYSESKEKIKIEEINPELENQYDYFSVGSDQIWSPKCTITNYTDYTYLKFTPKEKRISLAPSFGHSFIPKELEKEVREGLKGFKNLSVREEAGSEIIKKLTGKNAEVLLDPTMTIGREEWEKFSISHLKKPIKKYILTYFLGGIPEQANKILEKYNENKNYEIVNLNSLKDLKYYICNPSEWVDYIKDSSLFLTDSFHGVVFSIIFETPFSVYSRIGGKSMGSRISMILKKFSMEDRYEMTVDSKSLFNVNFSNVDRIIDKERKKTMNYLRKVLNLNYEK